MHSIGPSQRVESQDQFDLATEKGRNNHHKEQKAAQNQEPMIDP